MISLSTILIEYENIREQNKKALEERKERIFEELPRLKAIEKDMVKLGLEIAKTMLYNNENSESQLSKLKKEQNELKEEKVRLLKSGNYPIDYLEIRHRCKKCGDTGYVGLNKCTCLIQKMIKYNYLQSNLKEPKETFDHFNIEYYSETPNNNNLSPRKNMQHVFFECIKFVKDFDKHNKNLLFIGRPGLGKTFLCRSIANELLQSGKSVIYQSAPDLMDLVRKYKYNFENEEQGDEILNNLNTCDLLIIDDLGTELSTQFSGLVLYNILNKRLTDTKSMIIATNLDVKEIMRDYSERITSRIFGKFDMFEFFGDDIRLIMKMS